MLLYLKGDLSFADTTCGIILLSYFLSQYEAHSLQWIVKYNSDSSDNVNILTAIIRDQTHLYAQWPYLFTSTHTAVEKFCKTFSREKFVQCGYKYFKDNLILCPVLFLNVCCTGSDKRQIPVLTGTFWTWRTS